MIEITWLQLANPKFQDAIRTIWDCPMLDGQTSYSAYRIKQHIEKANQDVGKLRLSLITKYGKKDENGKLLNDEMGRIIFETPEEGDKFEAEFMKEFSDKKVSMKVSKLDFQKLTQVRGLTPSSWEFIAPIVENLPSLEDEEELPQEAAAPSEKSTKKKGKAIPFRANPAQ